MTTRRAYGLVAFAGFMAVVAVNVTGQSQRNPATLDDLLLELRGLRADLAKSSSASVRVQVLTARLALQEQRITALGHQFTDLQTRLSEASEKRREAEDGLKRWEAALSANTLQPEERKNLEQGLPTRKVEVGRLQASEQQIRSELTILSNAINVEQNQWTDFSNRLDELERSLSQIR